MQLSAHTLRCATRCWGTSDDSGWLCTLCAKQVVISRQPRQFKVDNPVGYSCQFKLWGTSQFKLCISAYNAASNCIGTLQKEMAFKPNSLGFKIVWSRSSFHTHTWISITSSVKPNVKRMGREHGKDVKKRLCTNGFDGDRSYVLDDGQFDSPS